MSLNPISSQSLTVFIYLFISQVLTVIWARELVNPQPKAKLGPVPYNDSHAHTERTKMMYKVAEASGKQFTM